MVDFTALLNRKADECEKPVAVPQGSYIMSIVGYTTGESRQKKTPYVEIETKIVAPREDVDMDEYAKVKNPQERSFKTPFYITEDSLYRLEEFLSKAGLPTAGRSFTEILAEMAGAQIVGIVSHRMSDDGESVFPEVKRFLKAE